MADDDWMFDASTRSARHGLATRIVEDHPTVVATADVTCNQAPLIVQGSLHDGRIYLFRARYGTASLAITWPNVPPDPAQTADCSDTLAVEDTDEAAAAFTELLAAHGLTTRSAR